MPESDCEEDQTEPVILSLGSFLCPPVGLFVAVLVTDI